ncbi:hypothetical protein OIDMADRAFT_20838 [Oidiodendron maius Zn]|uniref:Uncharacterized protein n=1 Tax=Oidiodendron maius (strain Zn) TaxID=913774 RepID=A0A0C3H200_OIDMZ|nr:hypothetical protein OIDMADRAFT_20838 [Oidiodendron maius Zn]
MFYKAQRSFRLSSLKLTKNKNLKNREEEDEGESLDVDWDRLRTDSEALARPPIEWPRKLREKLPSSVSEMDKVLGPVCRRPPTSGGYETLDFSHILFFL